MRVAAILSALLHGFILLLGFTGLVNFLRHDLEPPPIIPIEIMNISDVTQAPDRKVKPKDEAPKQEVEEKKPTPPKPVEEKTPEPEPEPEPKTVIEKSSEPEVTVEDLLATLPEEKPKDAVEKEKKEKKKKEKEKKKKEKKKKEKEKKKKQKKKKKDFMKLLNNIEKNVTASKGKTQLEQDENSTSDHAANKISDVLSITELDLIRRQLSACWNVPAGARDGKNLFVDVRIELNPDATVRSASIVKTSGKDTFARVAAESALRAVKNPRCNPLKLPRERYEQWKVIIIRFDPQHIL